ncbi:MAG: hypothetical protein JRN62_03420 [Nitrososphaerota archaeon]|jgi:hypothetical protein|nr:hypothetical protein [Nitrososphaerota archaeon]MDG6948648.1 hypothetical protein [Nitrososphaerota archaeon]
MTRISKFVDATNRFYDKHFLALHIALALVFVPQVISDPDPIFRIGGVLIILGIIFRIISWKRSVRLQTV